MRKGLISFTDEVLHNKCKEVPYNDKEIMETVSDSFIREQMLGLAAPQIGLPYQCAICYFEGGLEIVCNPEIEYLGNEVVSTERCMSYPNFVCKVKRFDKVRLKYYNQQWQLCDRILEGLDALIAQHEYDHLHGITVMDKAFKKSLRRG